MDNPPDDIRIAEQLLPGDEKSGRDALSFEHIQDLWRVSGIGSIIESQDHRAGGKPRRLELPWTRHDVIALVDYVSRLVQFHATAAVGRGILETINFALSNAHCELVAMQALDPIRLECAAGLESLKKWPYRLI